MKVEECMKNDIILNNLSIIERCIKRIYEEYANNPNNLENNTKQESIILNLQRACEASISLAMHIVAEKNWDSHKTAGTHFHYWNRKVLYLLISRIK